MLACFQTTSSLPEVLQPSSLMTDSSL